MLGIVSVMHPFVFIPYLYEATVHVDAHVFLGIDHPDASPSLKSSFNINCAIACFGVNKEYIERITKKTNILLITLIKLMIVFQICQLAFKC